VALARRAGLRTRPLLPWDRLVKGPYHTRDRKDAPVVPVRFVQAGMHGHIDDVHWYARKDGISCQSDGWLAAAGYEATLGSVSGGFQRGLDGRRVPCSAVW
jgi:hypothetical protein